MSILKKIFLWSYRAYWSEKNIYVLLAVYNSFSTNNHRLRLTTWKTPSLIGVWNRGHGGDQSALIGPAALTCGPMLTFNHSLGVPIVCLCFLLILRDVFKNLKIWEKLRSWSAGYTASNKRPKLVSSHRVTLTLTVRRSTLDARIWRLYKSNYDVYAIKSNKLTHHINMSDHFPALGQRLVSAEPKSIIIIYIKYNHVCYVGACGLWANTCDRRSMANQFNRSSITDAE